MHTQIETITPDLAKHYLETMIANRPFRETYARTLATDMSSGRWKLTHQGISFNKKGQLFDGQHRLWAVIYSRTPVQMMVSRNCDDSSVDCIDTHRTRSLVDVLVLQGKHATLAQIGTLKAMLSEGWGASTQTLPALEQEWAKHCEALLWTHKLFPNTAEWPRGLNNASVRSVIARASYSSDRTELEHFVRILRTGLSENGRGQPVITLRNAVLIRRSQTGMKITKRSLYLRTERALQAYLQNEQLTKLYEANSELFPLP